MPYPTKTENLCSILDLCFLLHKTQSFAQQLKNNLIKQCLDEVFISTQNGLCRPLPIFDYYISSTNRHVLCIHKEAIPTFITKHYNDFIRLGVKQQELDNILGNKAIPYNAETMITLSELGDTYCCHTSGKKLAEIIKPDYYTATYLIPSGHKQKMFFPVRLPNGMISICINRQAIPIFVSRYGKQIGLSDNLCAKLTHIYPAQSIDMINVNQFCEQLLKKSGAFQKVFLDFIKEKPSQEIIESISPQKTIQKEPLFLQAITRNGTLKWCIRKQNIPYFCNKYKDDLQKLGISLNILNKIQEEYKKIYPLTIDTSNSALERYKKSKAYQLLFPDRNS